MFLCKITGWYQHLACHWGSPCQPNITAWSVLEHYVYISNVSVYDRGWACQKKYNLSAGCGNKVQMHTKYLRENEECHQKTCGQSLYVRKLLRREKCFMPHKTSNRRGERDEVKKERIKVIFQVYHSSGFNLLPCHFMSLGSHLHLYWFPATVLQMTC